ncbi:MAG: STAS domain-containing protein [bacterium]|nr:STAS domain-containing protein [bacterium]MCP4800746.1 STAS domain-containing protein [bacterium]
MKISKSAHDSIMVLKLSGKIMGGSDHDLFHDEIKGLVADGIVDVVLNMHKVNWINSTGLGVLVSGYHTVKKNEGSMKICEVSDRIDSILNITQLKLVFDTYDSEAEALESYS